MSLSRHDSETFLFCSALSVFFSLPSALCFSFLSDYCYAAGSWTSSTVNGLTLLPSELRVAAGRRAGGRVRVFIVAGRVSARARATTHAVQSNWKRSPNFLACELRPHSVGRCVYYASHFLQPPLRPNPSPLPSLLCPQLSLCIL